MPVATLRLTAAEKRRFTAEARRRGLTLSEYLRRAGQAEASRVDWKTFFAANEILRKMREIQTDCFVRIKRAARWISDPGGPCVQGIGKAPGMP